MNRNALFLYYFEEISVSELLTKIVSVYSECI